MPVLTDIPLLATCRADGAQGDLHFVENAAIVWQESTFVWVGAEADIPEMYGRENRLAAEGSLVVPGLVDCHTHLAFGGWRADEFERRSRGATYQEIARSGGGILKTVRDTRATPDDDLVRRGAGFVQEMIRLGVTTLECKSGYGLSLDDELRTLNVYRRLQGDLPVEIVPTLLAAHAVPPEIQRARYIDLVCGEIIPEVGERGLAEFCDVFVEDGAFSVEEARRILEAGRAHGLRGKIHADQLSDSGGAALAAEVGAVSADHLEYSSDEGIRMMAESRVTAVCLPIATLYLRQKPMQARKWIDAGVAVAVATDFNPGSAPSFHLPLAMTLACIQSGMTPGEALKGATLFAARAIARDDRIGSIEPGKRADFVIVDAPSVNQWLYHFRPNAVVASYASGTRLEGAAA